MFWDRRIKVEPHSLLMRKRLILYMICFATPLVQELSRFPSHYDPQLFLPAKIIHLLTKRVAVPPIRQQSSDMRLEAIKYSAEKSIKISSQNMQTEAPSSHTPTSATTSDDGNNSRLSFVTQSSSNDISVVDSDTMNASDKKKAARPRPVLSIWTGAASTTRASRILSPLASVGSANAQPLSPPTARKSRFSHLFSDTKHVGRPDTPGSPFFANGLSGGLVTAMADLKVQQQKLGEDVKSYVTAHYASPSPIVIPQPGTKKWDEYIASLESAKHGMPSAGTGPSADFVEASTSTIGHGQRSRRISALLASVEKAADNFINDGTPIDHNPRAVPFDPRHAAMIENHQQGAEAHNGQGRHMVTRPRPAWDQVSNWRARGQEQNGPLPRASTYRSVHPARDTQSTYGGATGLSITAPHNVASRPSSQALTTTSQSSSSAHSAIGNRDTNDNNTNRRRTFEVFRPMNAVLNPDAHKQPLSEEEIAFRIDHGISLNYHGNHVNPRNISANIPDHENCAVWITNLPATCTVRDLLQALMHHRPGRVWASHINPPEEGRHRHAAAKIVFYHPSEARHFLDLTMQPGIVIQGRRMCAIYNKQRVAAQRYTYPTSRALEIRGDKTIVDETFLRSLFEQHFRFDEEAVEVLADLPDVRVMEWRFGSMRAQAGAAYKLLERMYPCVQIRFATDPCAQYMIMPGQEEEHMGQAVESAQSRMSGLEFLRQQAEIDRTVDEMQPAGWTCLFEDEPNRDRPSQHTWF